MALKKVLFSLTVFVFVYFIGVDYANTPAQIKYIFLNNEALDTQALDKKDSVEVLFDKEYFDALMHDIAHARKRIFIIMYVFKTAGYRKALPDRIVNMLIKRHAQGVEVSVLLNVDQVNKNDVASTELNETNLLTAKQLENNGITVYLDSPHKTTHAKIVIIDDNIVYIGSHNFTQSALKYNHEVSVRIESHKIAKKLIDYMEALEHE